MEKAVACCGNLVFKEEEDQTIHFTHSSVKQYLLSPGFNESLGHYHIDLQEADANAGAVCVTYLNFPIFTTLAARTANMSDNITSIPSMTVKRSLPSGNAANRIALALLRRHDKSSKSVSRLLEEASGDTKDHRQQSIIKQYSFQPYAEQFWLKHTKTLIDPSTKLWRLWCKLFEGAGWRDDLSGTSWTFEDWKQRSTDVIDWILEQNHCSLAQLLISSETKLTTEKLGLLFNGAAARGHTVIINISLRSGDVPETVVHSVLQSAARDGHVDRVQRLLQAGAEVNTAISEPYVGRTALQAAAEGGHLAVVTRLLQAGAEVNATLRESYVSRTALYLAAQGGHLTVVERLLQTGAEVNAAISEYNGITALQAAAQGGHLAVVERLLQAGAKVNAAISGSHSYRTALQAAAGDGYLAVVERLLQAGAEVNAAISKFDGRTALQAAAQGGHLAVVERLLQAGADVNAAKSKYDGRTALQAATEGGHLAVVKRLRYAGAK